MKTHAESPSSMSGLHLTERATIDRLRDSVEAVLPSLEQFLRFDTPETTGVRLAEWSARLDEPLPITGAGYDAVMDLLHNVIIPNGLPVTTPAFCGWVATGPTTLPVTAALAQILAAPHRPMLHAFNTLEAIALAWLADLHGIPRSYQGTFSGGGSTAHLIGLGAARQYAAERLGIDASRDGIAALPNPRVYASTEVHHVVHRAAAVLGLGRRGVEMIPTDASMRIDVAALRERLRTDRERGRTPVAIVANAGTVNTGAVDPIPELAKICREQDVWLHVDGAYGLPGVLDPNVAPQYGDLGAADSLVMDPHKWPAVPVGCGAAFVRDRGLLGRAFTGEPAEYLEDPHRDLAEGGPFTSQFQSRGHQYQDFGVDLSAPPKGVQVWAVLKEIGADGMRDRVRRHNAYARHLASRVEASPRLELLAPVTLSICCFRYVPPRLTGRNDSETTGALNTLNRAILDLLWTRGRCVPSGTTVNGKFAIRPCYINPRTTLADVDALVEEVEACGRQVSSEQPLAQDGR